MSNLVSPAHRRDGKMLQRAGSLEPAFTKHQTAKQNSGKIFFRVCVPITPPLLMPTSLAGFTLSLSFTRLCRVY